MLLRKKKSRNFFCCNFVLKNLNLTVKCLNNFRSLLKLIRLALIDTKTCFFGRVRGYFKFWNIFIFNYWLCFNFYLFNQRFCWLNGNFFTRNELRRCGTRFAGYLCRTSRLQLKRNVLFYCLFGLGSFFVILKIIFW